MIFQLRHVLMNHVRKAKNTRKTKFGRHVCKDVQNTPSNLCIRWPVSNERVEEKGKRSPSNRTPPSSLISNLSVPLCLSVSFSLSLPPPTPHETEERHLLNVKDLEYCNKTLQARSLHLFLGSFIFFKIK